MVDKIVTNLDADHVRICPDQVAKVTAETSPPNTPVVWAIDGNVISVLIGNTIIIGDAVHPVGQGQRVTVEARLDNTLSKEIVRSASRADVTLQPSPVDRVYAITSEPAMPAISALASGIGGDITVLKWGVKVLIDPTFVFEICLGMPPALQKTFDFSPAGGGSAIDVDFGGAIRGGRFEISVDGTVNDCPVTGAAAASLLGTNPRRSDIQASFPNDTIRRIACRESGQRQFNAPPDGGIGHCPLVRRADHVGIMQLAGPTDEQVWNWRANLDGGIEIFSERLDDARAYPGQVSLSAGFQDLVAQFNDIRQLDGKPALTIKAPEFSTGDLDDNLQQLELDAIRGYDGWFGDDRFGFELHEYRIGVDSIEGRDVLRVTDIDENVLTASGVWERVPPDDRPPSEGDPRYVESVLAFGAFCGAADPKPDPCGATLRLLNHQNHAINPADQALSVSNNVSDDTSLGSEAVAFDAISLDRAAFRFEIENPVPDHPVNIALIVGDRLPVLYGLDAKSGNRYRSPLIRLVSDEEDSRALGLLNTQNVLVRLGDELVALYEPGSGCVEKSRMRVGRPFTEQNNDHPDHSRHDIRDMRLRMTVFSKPAVSALLADISDLDQTIRLPSVVDVQPSGHVLIGPEGNAEIVRYTGTNVGASQLTGCTRGAEGTAAVVHGVGTRVVYSSTTPVASVAEVEADLTTVNERFAQAGVRVHRPVVIDLGGGGSPGRILPPALLAGYELSMVTFQPAPGRQPTDSEMALIALRSTEANVIDIFYVDHMFDPIPGDAIPGPLPGYARIALLNNSGDPRAQNFAVVSSIRKVFTVAHELLHLLLNDGHRGDQEPDTALFHPTQDDKGPRSTKRIGPYPDAVAAGVGVFDTAKIRVSAETLPD